MALPSFLREFLSFLQDTHTYTIKSVPDTDDSQGSIYSITERGSDREWFIFVVRGYKGVRDLASHKSGYISFSIDYKQRTGSNQPSIDGRLLDVPLSQEHHDVIADYLEKELNYEVIRRDQVYSVDQFTPSYN